MKKTLSILGFAAIFASCHYGQDEARKTLQTNEEYKTDKKEYSVNRANPDETMVADTMKKDTSAAK